MKLSKEAKELAQAIYHQKYIELDAENRSGLEKLRNLPDYQRAVHRLDITKKIVHARVLAYIEAYKKDRKVIDEEDKQEILREVAALIQEQSGDLRKPIKIPKFITSSTLGLIRARTPSIAIEFEKLNEFALAELNVWAAQLAMENKIMSPNIDLERKIRNIIKNDYGFGDQNIESEEIYNKLIAAGVEVPELAMDEIFDKLRKEGLIKGPARLNRDARHKHGATAIMWVSRYI